MHSKKLRPSKEISGNRLRDTTMLSVMTFYQTPWHMTLLEIMLYKTIKEPRDAENQRQRKAKIIITRDCLIANYRKWVEKRLKFIWEDLCLISNVEKLTESLIRKLGFCSITTIHKER